MRHLALVEHFHHNSVVTHRLVFWWILFRLLKDNRLTRMLLLRLESEAGLIWFFTFAMICALRALKWHKLVSLVLFISQLLCWRLAITDRFRALKLSGACCLLLGLAWLNPLKIVERSCLPTLAILLFLVNYDSRSGQQTFLWGQCLICGRDLTCIFGARILFGKVSYFIICIVFNNRLVL
jgi:hypothetical protein